ncbi:MAG: hypothetical protein ACHP65_01120 [Legionellales bacterium]
MPLSLDCMLGQYETPKIKPLKIPQHLHFFNHPTQGLTIQRIQNNKTPEIEFEFLLPKKTWVGSLNKISISEKKLQYALANPVPLSADRSSVVIESSMECKPINDKFLFSASFLYFKITMTFNKAEQLVDIHVADRSADKSAGSAVLFKANNLISKPKIKAEATETLPALDVMS